MPVRMGSPVWAFEGREVTGAGRLPGAGAVRRLALPGGAFRVEPEADGLRVVMSAKGGEPAAWVVPGRPKPSS